MKQRILLVGTDGHDLLNRIGTLDISRLEPGVKTLGLILNPQGKIRSSFSITKKAKDESEIEFEPPFLEILDQFTFGEKYEIRTQPAPAADAADESSRIAGLTPKLGNEFLHDEATNPLEVNLRATIHDNKGCYPGQEVIEKIISLGSPARKLVLVEVDSTIDAKSPANPLPQPLLDVKTRQEAGLLTSYSCGAGLAILKRTHLKEGTQLVLPENIYFTVKRISE
ncbi:MAG: hypothetical protein JST80_06095 [Bdellovibrionales bacterium]|nr:hypothetical protein [Bdellovibrionales bacterium]